MAHRSRDPAQIRRGSGVTMAEVGRLAGVSQVTVSRALSSPGKVSPETLQRITQAGFLILHKPVRPARLRAMLMHLLS